MLLWTHEKRVMFVPTEARLLSLSWARRPRCSVSSQCKLFKVLQAKQTRAEIRCKSKLRLWEMAAKNTRPPPPPQRPAPQLEGLHQVRVYNALVFFQHINHIKSVIPPEYYSATSVPCYGFSQGGRCWGNAGTTFPERSGSSTKGRTPNICYFVAKLSIVAIYALYEWPP